MVLGFGESAGGRRRTVGQAQPGLVTLREPCPIRLTFCEPGQATPAAVIAERAGVSQRLKERQASGKQALVAAVVAEVARDVAGLPPQELTELEQRSSGSAAS